jgi:hypothetical protein
MHVRFAVSQRAGLRVRWSKDRDFYVENLWEAQCSSAEDAIALFQQGTSRRVVAQHRLNATSSRSHCIFFLHVRTTPASADPAPESFFSPFFFFLFFFLFSPPVIFHREASLYVMCIRMQVERVDARFPDQSVVSKLALVDLAGSERSAQTGRSVRLPARDLSFSFLLRAAWRSVHLPGVVSVLL